MFSHDLNVLILTSFKIIWYQLRWDWDDYETDDRYYLSQMLSEKSQENKELLMNSICINLSFFLCALKGIFL